MLISPSIVIWNNLRDEICQHLVNNLTFYIQDTFINFDIII